MLQLSVPVPVLTQQVRVLATQRVILGILGMNTVQRKCVPVVVFGVCVLCSCSMCPSLKAAWVGICITDGGLCDNAPWISTEVDLAYLSCRVLKCAFEILSKYLLLSPFFHMFVPFKR